jgi:hypothetical protein
MVSLFVGFGLLVGLFLLYIGVFSFVRPSSYIGDDLRHMYMIKRVREEEHRLPPTITKYLLSQSPNYYPAFFHKVLSYFPEMFISKFGRAITPFFIVAQTLLLYVISLLLFRELGVGPSASLYALISALIWFFMPFFWFTWRGIWWLTERHFANFIIFSTLALFFTYFQTGVIWYLLAGYIFMTATLCSGQFPIQILFFVAMPLFFLLFSWQAFLFLLGFPLAFFLSRGYYFNVFKTFMKHFIFRFKEKQYFSFNWSHQDIWSWPRFLWKRDVRGLLMFLLVNPVPALLTQIPFMYYLLMVYQDLLYISVLNSLWFAVLFSFFVAIMFIVVPQLIVIGEPQRYVEYALPAVAILSAYGLFRNPDSAWLFILCTSYSAAFWILLLFLSQYNFRKQQATAKHFSLVKSYLQKQKPQRLLTIPMTLAICSLTINDTQYSII